jgi:hypothetical protein
MLPQSGAVFPAAARRAALLRGAVIGGGVSMEILYALPDRFPERPL